MFIKPVLFSGHSISDIEHKKYSLKDDEEKSHRNIDKDGATSAVAKDHYLLVCELSCQVLCKGVK